MNRARSNLSGLAVVAAAVFVGFLAAIPFLAGKDARAFLVLLVVPAIGVVAWRFLHSGAGATQKSDAPQNQHVRHGTLAIAAFCAGPIIAGLFCLPFFLAENMHPDDVRGTVIAVVFLGFVAGSVVALAVWLLPAHDK